MATALLADGPREVKLSTQVVTTSVPRVVEKAFGTMSVYTFLIASRTGTRPNAFASLEPVKTLGSEVVGGLRNLAYANK